MLKFSRAFLLCYNNNNNNRQYAKLCELEHHNAETIAHDPIIYFYLLVFSDIHVFVIITLIMLIEGKYTSSSHI